jgi:hypothetical protein
MGRGGAISTIVAAGAILCACNTTDAMIPRVGIGENAAELYSSPVTQGDAERMAAAAPSRRALASPAPGTYNSAYDRQPSRNQEREPDGTGAPATTLDAQADAIRNGGRNPYESAPLDRQQQTAAISNGGEILQDDERREADRRLSEEPQPQPQKQAQKPDDQQAEQQASLPPAAASDGNTIRFLPIIGAPVEAVTPLSRQLGTEARARGLSIKSSTDTSSSYILKGYLSAFQDGPAVTISYVWDVLDSNGNRLHRIQGTESAPLKAGDPWTSVPPSVMQRIATETMAEFTSWRQSRGG